MITQKQLKTFLEYDPLTGIFTWIKPTSRRVSIGQKVTCQSNWGYVHIGLLGKRHKAHRLAWLYMTGEWPEDGIDHRNGIRNDNRWLNLRPASKAQNGFNSKTPVTNTTGFKGVYRSGKRFRAQLKINGSHTHLGCFGSPEEAYSIYCAAVEQHRGEFGRTA